MEPLGLQVCWASNAEDIKRVQRFRFQVFSEEYSAQFPQAHLGLDEDVFDPVCDHLLVLESATQKIVGCYRIIPPSAAQEIGSMYCDSLFDLTPLKAIRSKIVEMDRSCIDKKYRNGSIILFMWKLIFNYLKQHDYEYIMGCSSMSIQDGGHKAVALHHRLNESHHVSSDFVVHAKTPIDLDISPAAGKVCIPPILKGYLNVGAKVCSEPAFDPLFNTADYLTILKVSEMKPKYVQRFSR